MKKIAQIVCIINICLFSVIAFFVLIGIFAAANSNDLPFFIGVFVFVVFILLLNILSLRRVKEQNFIVSLPNKIQKKEKNIITYTGAKKINIDYVDAKGDSTNRDIEIKYVYYENDIYYLRAFCYLRNEERTFKIENIKKMYVNEAEIDDPKLYFETKTNNSELSDK